MRKRNSYVNIYIGMMYVEPYLQICQKHLTFLLDSLLIAKVHAYGFDKETTSLQKLNRLFDSSETKDENKQDV